jgi:hypothetical protein
MLAGSVGDAIGRGADRWVGTDQALRLGRVPPERLGRIGYRAVTLSIVGEGLQPIQLAIEGTVISRFLLLFFGPR